MGIDMGFVLQPHSKSASDRRTDHAATLTYYIAPKGRKANKEKLFRSKTGEENK